ncbi:MAG: hypothetical protein LBM41_07070 [Ruminococcus sp.]|jgi:hypothetical protein|nr:hypothetical protein [Ruminococcus sp.]
MSNDIDNDNKTADSITIRGELEAALTNPHIREYLDGIFTMLRTVVGINCMANDFTATELKKKNPDLRAINDTLSNNDAQMMAILGSLSEAHHLLSLIDTPETDAVSDISETLSAIVEKITPLFAGNIEITSNIEPLIFAPIDKISFEIAVADYIEHFLNGASKPKSLDFKLKSNGAYEATLIILATPGGLYPVPGRTESEKAVRTAEFSGLLMENLLHRMRATVRHTSIPGGSEVELRFSTAHAYKPKLLVPDNKFEFENARFSPVSAKLYKYFAVFNKRY